MGIRKQKPGSKPIRAETSRRPVKRDYVDELQRRATELNEAIEIKVKIGNEQATARQRQRQIQQQMAHLRGEALQARRLAEQIDNRSRETAARKRKRTMTNTTTSEPVGVRRPNRRASDTPATGGSQSNFNPLHPSMELPPEQLIRLLGLEDKKGRKKRKSPAAKKPARPAVETRPENTPKQPTTTAKPPAPDKHRAAHRSPQPSRRRQQQADASIFGDARRGLLLPALGFGAVAGLTLSVYLFWGQPDTPKTAARSPESATSVSASKPAPVIRKPVEASAEQKDPVPTDNPKWRAAIRAQEQRLRSAARQRQNERLELASRSVAAEVHSRALVAIPNPATEIAPPPVVPTPSASGDAVENMPAAAPIINEVEPPTSAGHETPPAAPVAATVETEPASEMPDSRSDKAAMAPPQAPDELEPATPTADQPGEPVAASDSRTAPVEQLPPAEAETAIPAITDVEAPATAPSDATPPDYSETLSPVAGDAESGN